ncbi:MAG: transaldolase family protein [Candidatus Omnitrophota bacterium]|nr:transaldolase family protein [Candidatus Omnitrophota bacterium]
MELFIDTANIDEIREIARWGVIRGVTTNPKIFAKEGVDLRTRVEEILEIVSGPLSVEVTTNDPAEMIIEAQKLAAWSKHIVVKLPMSPAGLEAASVLKNKGIKTNVTAIMTVNQAMLAASAGATYASIFYSRISDLGHDGLDVIRQSAQLFKQSNFTTKIIVGSIRLLTQINDAALAGADIITVPYKFFPALAYHPQTELTIQEFLNAWQGTKTLA